jgi:hypothetical protein
MNQSKSLKTNHRLFLAFFENEHAAKQALQSALDAEIPMDRVSILGQASSSGDDPLGIYYPKVGDRMVGWGEMGALWGGLWGLFTGAMGMFLIPGLAPMFAAGPIVEALISAAGGAGIGGGVLAGAGAISHLGVAVHRMGVPHDQIEKFHNRLERGQYLLMLIVGNEESEVWQSRLSRQNPALLADYPYVGYVDAVMNAVE